MSATLRRSALMLGALLSLVPVEAQESKALIDALIRKGILTQQEAEEIRAEVMSEPGARPASVEPGGRSTRRLSVGMRMQTQYANLDTDVRGEAFGPAATHHAFLRRMYLTFEAEFGGNWGAVFTYDFAGGGYDDAIITWEPSDGLAFNFGLRKVNVGYEERASSGNIKAIERSSVTRYFVESNNDRRLGAASYRIGLFLDGKKELTGTYGLVYSAAITNPERSDTFEDAGSRGDRTNNNPAVWGGVGLTGRLARGGTWTVGTGAGFLPDQGGFDRESRGRGFDLRLHSVYAEIDAGRFGFLAEYLAAQVDRGAAADADASPRGFFLQPSVRLNDAVELVFRHAWLDTDGRGLTLSDAIRSAPGNEILNTVTEWYAGANWYLRGNDLKLQLGAVYGEARDTMSGAPAGAETVGVRSQMQVQF